MPGYDSPLSPSDEGNLRWNLPPQSILGIANVAIAAAEAVRRAASDGAAPGYERVCGPIDPSLDDDDPLTRLERQVLVEDRCRVVTESAGAPELTLDQAEAWLSVLTTFTGLLAQTHGIVDDETREQAEAQDPEFAAGLNITQVLQQILVDGLDQLN